MMINGIVIGVGLYARAIPYIDLFFPWPAIFILPTH